MMNGGKPLIIIQKELRFVMNQKTTVGKIDDQNCLVMLYDVDMVGLQNLMSSDFLVELTEKMNIKNNEMHSFEPLPS